MVKDRRCRMTSKILVHVARMKLDIVLTLRSVVLRLTQVEIFVVSCDSWKVRWRRCLSCVKDYAIPQLSYLIDKDC